LLLRDDSLKEFLPQSYIKAKAVEKKIFGEHKKHATLSEIEAKVAYVKTARSLSTYGVTFFLVKVLSDPIPLKIRQLTFFFFFFRRK